MALENIPVRTWLYSNDDEIKDRGSRLSTLVVTLQEQVLGEQITAGQLTELK